MSAPAPRPVPELSSTQSLATTEYRRRRVPGARCFFTVVRAGHRPILATPAGQFGGWTVPTIWPAVMSALPKATPPARSDRTVDVRSAFGVEKCRRQHRPGSSILAPLSDAARGMARLLTPVSRSDCASPVPASRRSRAVAHLRHARTTARAEAARLVQQNEDGRARRTAACPTTEFRGLTYNAGPPHPPSCQIS